MKRLVILFLFIGVCAVQSLAQTTDDKKFEFFAGYSLQTDNRETNNGFKTVSLIGLPPNITPAQFKTFTGMDFSTNSGRVKMHGFNTAATYYFNKRFGITGDFSAHFKSEPETFANIPFRITKRSFNFLGGPHVKFRGDSKAEPFIHALFGATRLNNKLTASAPPDTIIDNYTSFSVALGGGVDLKLNDRVALRLFQIDYLPVFARDRRVVDTAGNVLVLRGYRRDNVRISVGLVFR